MRSEIKRGYAAAATMTIAIALLILNMVGPMISTTTDFSIYNSGWNGTSNLAVSAYKMGKLSPTLEVRSTETEMEIAQLGLDQIDLDPTKGSLIIIGPNKPFTQNEGRIVGDFVKYGGVLLLADDFGTANSLLEFIGAGSRFSNKLALDLAYEKKPEFSVCFDFEQDPITNNVSTLLLNYPSTVSPANGTEVIARTSVASWIDLDGDRSYTYGEPWGPFPLIVREPIGTGMIILLADPSILINGMRSHLDNAIFSDNLVADISSKKSLVYFDESHHEYLDPVSLTMAVTGSISTDAKIMLILLALVLLLWLSTDYVDKGVVLVWRNLKILVAKVIALFTGKKAETKPIPAEDYDELTKLLMKEHPEWKPGLLRYAIREKARHSEFFSNLKEEQ